MGDLDEGMNIYQIVFENGFLLNVVIVITLVDVYTRYQRIQMIFHQI